MEIDYLGAIKFDLEDDLKSPYYSKNDFPYTHTPKRGITLIPSFIC